MPYCRSLGNGCGLHSFVEKTRKTPARDLRLALKRMQEVLCDDA
jgi:phage-related protein